MPTLRRLLVLGLLLLLAPLGRPGAAQEDTGACPALVQQALETAGEVCAGLTRNEACYGHVMIEALAASGAEVPDFGQPGDISAINTIARLATAPFDLNSERWGVAILSLQADLPDTLPGQNVTFVLFGDVDMQAGTVLRLPAAVARDVNVRAGPSGDAALVGELAAGDTVNVLGQNAAGDWQRIEFVGPEAWVLASGLALSGDATTLPVLAPGEAPPSLPAETDAAPFQAFTLRAGLHEPACDDVPPDGVLVQAPQETTVHFTINGVEVEVGSTAYLRIDPDGSLRASNFDGSVGVASGGEEVDIEPGLGTTVIYGQPPNDPAPFNYERLRAVPTGLLPDDVGVPLAVDSALPAAAWADSGVAVTAGESFSIQAGGQINLFVGCEEAEEAPPLPCSAYRFGPQGNSRIVPEGEYYVPDANVGALVGRIGEGTPFLVGTGGTFTAEEDGTLQFRINDPLYLEDNGGFFTVRISVRRSVYGGK